MANEKRLNGKYVRVWAFGTKPWNFLFGDGRKDYQRITRLPGYIGKYRMRTGWLWLFGSVNDAKGARNIMESELIHATHNIYTGLFDGHEFFAEEIDNG